MNRDRISSAFVGRRGYTALVGKFRLKKLPPSVVCVAIFIGEHYHPLPVAIREVP